MAPKTLSTDGSCRWLLAGFLLLLLGGQPRLDAQPVPQLKSVSTIWLQRGTTNELVFEGENLGAVTGFIFSGDKGLSANPMREAATSVTIEASEGGISVGDDENKSLRARLTVEAGASLGSREVRLVSAAGVSNPLMLNVGFLREILDQEGNNSTNEAQWIELPVAVTGAIQEADDIDTFRFKAEKGQRLTFDIYANRIGSPLDSSLALLDASGRELKRSEDAIGFDSLIDFTVPETGEYFLQLRDFRFQGGGNYKYRLEAGALPYLDGIFPLGARRGQNVEVALRGRNLDGVDKLKLRIAPDAPLGVQELRAHAPKGFSNARNFVIGRYPEMIEQEPNDEIGKASGVDVPGVANGQIGSAKDVDIYKFKANKDQTLVFDIDATKFGSSLDALLTVMNSKGDVLARNDDSGDADARIERRFDEAGDYYVSVRDLLDRGGAEFPYRLTIAEPQPDFSVKYFPDSPVVHRGGRVAVNVEITRRAGFGGPVEVAFEGLPGGVTSSSAVIPPELGDSVIILQASNDAPLEPRPLKLVGRGTINGRIVAHDGQPLVQDRPAKEGFLTVTEGAPFEVELDTPTASTEQEQSAALELRVIRRNGFTGPVKLIPEGFTAGRDPLTKNIDVEGGDVAVGGTRGTIRLRAKLSSEIGTRLIWVRGEAAVNGQTMAEYSRAIPLTVSQFPFTLANNLKNLSLTVLPPESKSAAGEAELVIKADRRGWFTDQIDLSVEGLPEGVLVNATNLPNRAAEATFKLTATDKAPVGKEISFTVVGTANVAGRDYRQRTAPIKLTINVAPAMAEAGTKPQASK